MPLIYQKRILYTLILVSLWSFKRRRKMQKRTHTMTLRLANLLLNESLHQPMTLWVIPIVFNLISNARLWGSSSKIRIILSCLSTYNYYNKKCEEIFAIFSYCIFRGIASLSFLTKYPTFLFGGEGKSFKNFPKNTQQR